MTRTTALAHDFEPRICRAMGAGMPCGRASDRTFAALSALLFAAAAALTLAWCASMSRMPGMRMPGGWTMSMAWMRMPGQTWLESAASFAAMWIVMMAAMMLPSLTPVLWRYRRSLGKICAPHQGRLAALAALGYFFVWASLGAAVYLVGTAAASLEMQYPVLSHAIP